MIEAKDVNLHINEKYPPMKRIIIYIIGAVSAVGMHAADGDLFPYPKPTDDMTTLVERCDYLVSQFWKRCDFKSAMSKKDALNSTFGDWISFMPYANADTVHAAIDRLLASVAKSGPHTLELARMAESWAHSDSADVYSDEIFLPFAKAAAAHKKIKAEDRSHFATQAQIIENTETGKPLRHLEYVTPQGETRNIDNLHTQMILVIFGRYDSDAANLARVRLSADINATALIRAGLLTVIYLQPGEATDEWKAAAAGYPEDWTIGASPDAREYFPLRTSPAIYLLDARHKILLKEVQIDGLLAALTTLRQNTGI